MTIFTNELIGKRESVTDEILLLNPSQTPMLNLLGFGQPVTSTTHVWYEDAMFATRTTVTAAVAVDATEIKVASTEPFRPHTIAEVGDELVLIQAVDSAANKISVVRGYSGTTAAAIAKDAMMESLYGDSREGADARDARYKSKTKGDNVTQIFEDTVSVTGSAEAVAQYGIGSSGLYEYEKAKKQLELALQLEKAIIGGRKFDSGNMRTMRGVRSFIETNMTTAGGPVTKKLLDDVTQKVYSAGGFATGNAGYTFVVPAVQKRAISDMAFTQIRLTQAENSRGQKVDHIVNDFGTFQVVLNDNLKPDEILFVDANRIKVRPLGDRSFGHTYLGVKGDYQSGIIVGEYTLELQQEKAHARIKGLTA
ncbi:SU10 major capsid protein [Paenibacillus sp. 1-18]|uniref:SU10 major capsid protein n=1 Tax=Paenibacillus sp. 1-18 TaxID=1333846 RepID=UPI0004B9B15B